VRTAASLAVSSLRRISELQVRMKLSGNRSRLASFQ
jgi:hypothetical protein